DHPSLGRDIGEILGRGKIGIPISPNLEEVGRLGDIFIDFTNPITAMETLRCAKKLGKKAVIGTTGLGLEELKEAKEIAQEIAIVLSPNMSIGVNLLFNLVGEVVRVLGKDYDIEIIEAHHRGKKDAPSGTALKLGEIIASNQGKELSAVAIYGREGATGPRTREEIGIHGIRAGDIIGEHTVMFAGVGERIELIHRAHSRENFAHGALRAVIWLSEQTKGLYSMLDVLGMKEGRADV
ncbi:MAG: 4-hydroxy-tetrahydrodipicolinate reductase, partial [bacterium]|nr:4-hydroxy-tetrahydrodipicolinate reductase [bacterium]